MSYSLEYTLIVDQRLYLRLPWPAIKWANIDEALSNTIKNKKLVWIESNRLVSKVNKFVFADALRKTFQLPDKKELSRLSI